MKTIRNLTVLSVAFLFLFALDILAQDTKLDNDFYKKLEGTIGNDSVEIDMLRFGHNIEGHFYYRNKEEKGIVYGRISDNGTILLDEQEGIDKKTGEPLIVGTFDGEFSNSTTFKGTWRSSDGETSKKFLFEEKYFEGVSKFNIVRQEKKYGKQADILLLYAKMDESGKHKKAAKKINKYIGNHILNYAHPKSNRSKFDDHHDFLQDFIKRYKEMESTYKGSARNLPLWENEHRLILDYNNHNVVVFEFVEVIFEGGAYPESTINYVNFNLETGDKFALSDILVHGYEAKLNELGEKLFRETYGFKEIKSFAEEGINFKDDKFSLNDNFSISKGGLLFRFNENEIAPHFLGSFEIFIPYSQILDIIKKNSPLNTIVKNHY
jgi:hypothetical protein